MSTGAVTRSVEYTLPGQEIMNQRSQYLFGESLGWFDLAEIINIMDSFDHPRTAVITTEWGESRFPPWESYDVHQGGPYTWTPLP